MRNADRPAEDDDWDDEDDEDWDEDDGDDDEDDEDWDEDDGDDDWDDEDDDGDNEDEEGDDEEDGDEDDDEGDDDEDGDGDDEDWDDEDDDDGEEDDGEDSGDEDSDDDGSLTEEVPADYGRIIANATVAAAGLGVPGVLMLGADVAGMTVIWTGMTAAIARESGHRIGPAYAGKLAAAVASGAAAYWGGSKLFTGLLAYGLPGIGTLGAAAINSVLNGLYTYRFGQAMAKLFSKPGVDLRDFSTLANYLVHAIKPVPTLDEVRRIYHLIHGA
jgi:hypothetical protein